jgi:ketosteroid isomerase-like protein
MTDFKSGSDVVGAFFAALGGGDFPGALALLDDEVVWTYHGPSASIPFAGTFGGKAGVEAFFGAFGSVAEPIEMTPRSMVEAAGQVYVRGIEKARVKATGKEYSVEWVHVIEVADGLILRFDEYLDSAAVAAAFA